MVWGARGERMTARGQAQNGLQAGGQRPFVSVIIPCFSDEQRLPLCLRALEMQSYPSDRYDVIVVDDASPFSLESLVSDFTHARCLTQHENRGSYSARNRGVAAARGDVYAFTDSDCIPEPNWLEKGVRPLLDHPHCGQVGGRIDVFFRDANHPSPAELFDSVLGLKQKTYIDNGRFAATANMFTTRGVIQVVGPFDELLRSGGDNEWGKRVHGFGFRQIYAEDAVVRHPARRTIDALKLKRVRTVQGFLQAALENVELRSAYKGMLLKGLLPPVGRYVLPVLSRKDVRFHIRLAASLIALRIHYFTYGQMWLRFVSFARQRKERKATGSVNVE